MKTISIGDIHGRDFWKKVDPKKYDKIIFVGDYVDAYHMNGEDILSNLLDIIQFKKDNPDKVILCLGNHDIQYLWHPNHRCSGFRPEMLASLYPLFNENRQLFQVAYQIKNYIWTHAGISNAWFDMYSDRLLDRGEDETLADRLNDISNTNQNWMLHEVGERRGGMRYDVGGITWADRFETISNYLEGFHQIVGHTPIDKITTVGDKDSSITYIDTAGKQFYELEV